MKILNNVFRVLSIVFSVVALILFFLPFGKVVLNDGNEIVRAGTEFAFGSSYNGADTGKSSDILLCLILTAATVLFSALSFKFKGVKWAAFGFSLIDAIYMLVIACSAPRYFLDTQGFVGVFNVEYVNAGPLLICIALFITFGCVTTHILISDKIAIAKTAGALTIPKRIVKFLRDYKGEVKKIVWPGPRAIVKNTLIVIVMCLILGAFIWLIDLGLGYLLDLLFN